MIPSYRQDCDPDEMGDRSHLSRTQIRLTRAHGYDHRNACPSAVRGLPEGQPNPRPRRREMEHARRDAAARRAAPLQRHQTQYRRHLAADADPHLARPRTRRDGDPYDFSDEPAAGRIPADRAWPVAVGAGPAFGRWVREHLAEVEARAERFDRRENTGNGPAEAASPIT